METFTDALALADKAMEMVLGGMSAEHRLLFEMAAELRRVGRGGGVVAEPAALAGTLLVVEAGGADDSGGDPEETFPPGPLSSGTEPQEEGESADTAPSAPPAGAVDEVGDKPAVDAQTGLVVPKRGKGRAAVTNEERKAKILAKAAKVGPCALQALCLGDYFLYRATVEEMAAEGTLGVEEKEYKGRKFKRYFVPTAKPAPVADFKPPAASNGRMPHEDPGAVVDRVARAPGTLPDYLPHCRAGLVTARGIVGRSNAARVARCLMSFVSGSNPAKVARQFSISIELAEEILSCFANAIADMRNFKVDALRAEYLQGVQNELARVERSLS